MHSLHLRVEGDGLAAGVGRGELQLELLPPGGVLPDRNIRHRVARLEGLVVVILTPDFIL